MRPGATERTERTERVRPASGRTNPFRAGHHWTLGTDTPRLVIDGGSFARPSCVPERPTLLTGFAGSGRRATIDHVCTHATHAGWLVVRVHAAATDPRRLDAVAGALALGADAAAVGVLVCVDELHALAPADARPLLADLAARCRDARRPTVRVLASATHRSSLPGDARASAFFDDVPLVLDVAELAHVLGALAVDHGRVLDVDAAWAIHAASGGVAGIALALMAAAWDATRGERITRDCVASVRGRVEASLTTRVRASRAVSFTLGQRRYLRAVAMHGGRAGTEDVRRTLRELTRFAISDAMFDAVSSALVRQGVLVVDDGVATIAVPGLAQVV